MSSNIKVGDILHFLSDVNIPYSFEGDESTEIKGFSSLNNYIPGTFTWIKKQENIDDRVLNDSITLAIVAEDVKVIASNVIKTAESKQAFFSSIEHFYSDDDNYPQIGQFTYIGPNVKLGKNVRIGHNCSLDGEIIIGDNTVIWNNVSIIHKVTIGDCTEIQSGCVIGHDGFGYTQNQKNQKNMVKHFGGVTIGNNVLISSNVCVARGTIDDTVIEDGAKIDSLSHIAHNCHIGENATLAFPCSLGGSSIVETNGYIAGSIIRNQCRVNKNGFVGMGAVVTKDVPADTIVIGNPAREYIKV